MTVIQEDSASLEESSHFRNAQVKSKGSLMTSTQREYNEDDIA